MQEMMMNEGMGEETGSPLDSIIATVDSYIANPQSVTPETLTQLKEELVDLKSYIDGETPTDSDMGISSIVGQAAQGE